MELLGVQLTRLCYQAKHCSIDGSCCRVPHQLHNRSFGALDCSTCHKNGVAYIRTRSKTDNCRWRSVSLNGHIVRVICCVTMILCGPMRSFWFWRSFAVLCSPLWSFAVFSRPISLSVPSALRPRHLWHLGLGASSPASLFLNLGSPVLVIPTCR